MVKDSCDRLTARGIILSLFIIVLFMGTFVLSTVGYGLPQQLDPDERYFIVSAVNLFVPPLLDPGWYGHPASTLHLLLAFVYACQLIIRSILEYFQLIGGINDDLYDFFIFGRIIVILIYIMCAVATFRVAILFLSNFSSAISCIFMLIFPQIIYHSSIIRADLLLILVLNFVFLYCIKIVVDGKMIDYVFAGAAIGLATVTKYPGVVGAVPLLIALAIDWRVHGRSPFDIITRAAIAGFVSVVSAFMVAPFLFLNFDQVVADLSVQGIPRLGATSEGFVSTLWFYLSEALPKVTGTWPWLMSIVGLTWALFKTQKVLPLLAFGGAFLMSMSFLTLQWVRWMLPLTPIVALGVGAFSDLVINFLGTGKFRSYAIVLCLLVLGAVPGAVQSSELLIKRARNADTRIVSEQWVNANLPCGSVILVETYAPQLENGCHTVLVPQGGRLVGVDGTTTIGPRPPAFFGSFGSELKGAPLSLLDNSKIDFIIESSWRERFTAEAALYREEIQVYEAISDRTTKLKTFDAGDELLGPSIVIYSVNK